jgi:hypothetical protein
MRLVIDALELCYAREHINTFVIASGDSDFCPLAYKLRENDRFVIGLAVKEATSPFFVKACDEFIYLKGQGRTEDRGARPASRGRPEKHGAPSTPSTEPGSKKPRAVPVIAREVVSNLLSRATGPLNPSLIKETIVRKEPDFDERDHGFSTFSRMLEAMEKEGLLKRQQQGRQWYVVAHDATGDVKNHEPDAIADGGPAAHDEEVIPDPEDDDLAL